jgi:hypothetical protein
MLHEDYFEASARGREAAEVINGKAGMVNRAKPVRRDSDDLVCTTLNQISDGVTRAQRHEETSDSFNKEALTTGGESAYGACHFCEGDFAVMPAGTY